MTINDILLYFSLKHNGDWDEVYRSIKRRDSVDEEEFKNLKSKLGRDYQVVSILDSNYPEQLKQASKPSYLFFYKGNLDLLSDTTPVICVSSSETCSFDSKRDITSIIDNLGKENNKNTLLMELNNENDKKLLLTALVNNFKVILISNKAYLDFQKNELINLVIEGGGLVITEKAFNNESHIQSGRLASGLSDYILFSSISKDNLSLLHMMLENGKEVMVIPHSITEENDYSNKIIQEGANLITCARDIVEFIA